MTSSARQTLLVHHVPTCLQPRKEYIQKYQNTYRTFTYINDMEFRLFDKYTLNLCNFYTVAEFAMFSSVSTNRYCRAVV